MERRKEAYDHNISEIESSRSSEKPVVKVRIGKVD